MNQSFQPTPSSSSGDSCPVNADVDPYYSIAMNIPSGPISSTGYQALSNPSEEVDSTAAAPAPAAPRGHQNFQSGLEVLEEIDIRTFQLEDSEPQEPQRPMPIRNAFRVEPIKSASCDATLKSCQPQEIVSQDEAGRFIARENSVVCVDGNEGFDYIDLSDRDIAHVTFGESCMTVVDANTGESFTIRFQNVSHALFANGKMVELP